MHRRAPSRAHSVPVDAVAEGCKSFSCFVGSRKAAIRARDLSLLSRLWGEGWAGAILTSMARGRQSVVRQATAEAATQGRSDAPRKSLAAFVMPLVVQLVCLCAERQVPSLEIPPAADESPFQAGLPKLSRPPRALAYWPTSCADRACAGQHSSANSMSATCRHSTDAGPAPFRCAE